MHDSTNPMGRRRAPFGRRAGLAAVAACLAMVAAACGSTSTASGTTASTSGSASTSAATSATTASSSGSSSSSNASAGKAFFKGKTITFIAPDKPGGGFDNWARTLAPYIGKYLGATVNIENIPAGNTIVGQNTMASAKPDGLTIGWLNVVEDISDKAAGISGVNFDPTKVSILGATPPVPVVVIATKPSGYTSFSALASAAGPVKALTQTKGSTALIERVIFAGFGVKTKYIAGYESSASLKAGFSRGDGAVAVDNISAFGPFITGGTGVPLLVSSTPSKSSSLYSALKNVPTLASYSTQHPPTGNAGKVLQAVMTLYQYNTTLAAPAGVPAARVAALQAAMKYATEQPAAIQQGAKVHLNVGYESPSAAVAAMKAAQADASIMKPYVPGG